MQKFNYHTHTERCGHAQGSDEAYVLEAIKNGYTHIGFSDHAPYTNGYSAGERMRKEELQDYISSVKALKEKYKDQIHIALGLEFEYYESHLEELKQYKNDMDYMLLGQHDACLYGKDFYTHSSDEDILEYASLIEKACEKELPDIIAHPDLFMFGKEEWNEACEKAAHIICKSAEKHHVYLEINLNGLRYGKRQLGKEYRYTYPYRKFWEIASQYDVKCIYGLDAHKPEKYADEECYHIVDEILKDIPLQKEKMLIL